MEKIIDIKKALTYNYILNDFFECGIVLVGWEVKAIRSGSLNISKNYVIFKNGEAFVSKMYVSGKGFIFDNFDIESRNRKLLLKRKEIISLYGMSKIKGHTLLLSKIYLKNNLIKGEICLCSGKKKYDKKMDLKLKSLSRSTNYL
ncbi:MAG TPA: SsrA-binding protein [Candidatus Azoamicus sp.]